MEWPIQSTRAPLNQRRHPAVQDAEMEFAPSHVRTLCRVRKTVVVYLRLVNLIADSISSLRLLWADSFWVPRQV